MGEYSYFKCGTVADVFATVDFGPWGSIGKYFPDYYKEITNNYYYILFFFLLWLLVNQSLQFLKEFQNGGPLVNSEYYTGWGSFWGRQLDITSSDIYLSTLKDLLALNASINIFLFYGGTNFGFTSGAVKKSNQNYTPSATSYDFNAPLNEAGDPTEKYFKIKKLLEETVSLHDNINLYV